VHMGLKRIIFQAEVTYPGDAEDLGTLAINTHLGLMVGVTEYRGAVARFQVLSAYQDPDPEPEADGGVTIRPPGSGDE
jgi:hypothetical protein